MHLLAQEYGSALLIDFIINLGYKRKLATNISQNRAIFLLIRTKKIHVFVSWIKDQR